VVASLAALLVLAAAAPAPQAEASAPPFRMTLPDGWAEFHRVESPAAEAWESRRDDARMLVRRFLLEAPGARPEAVAREVRNGLWRSLLEGVEHEVRPWRGAWAGGEAAGHRIAYRHRDRAMVVLERFRVLGDVLLQATWEGPAAEAEAAEAALATFLPGPSWAPAPLPRRDPDRGRRPGSLARPFPGGLEVRARWRPAVPDRPAELEVRVRREADAEPEAGTLPWLFPEGADVLESGPLEVRYRLVLSPEAPVASWGLAPDRNGGLAALDAGWLAVPDPGPGAVAPPAWRLVLLHPAHFTAFGPDGAVASELDPGGEEFRTEPVVVGADRLWPGFLVGRYAEREGAPIPTRLRLDAQAVLPDEAPRLLGRLAAARRDWLGVPAPAVVVSHPGLGDRVFGDVVVLDETRGWWDAPADGSLDGEPRVVHAARLLMQQVFGGRLHGDGTAAPFLEASLAEWAAARLLERAGDSAAARRLRESWRAREGLAGPLPMPLSLLGPADLFGPRRLLTAGPLLWEAVAARVGGEDFEAWLAERARSGGRWDTADLEAGLGRLAPQEDWRAFLDARLYSVHQP